MTAQQFTNGQNVFIINGRSVAQATVASTVGTNVLVNTLDTIAGESYFSCDQRIVFSNEAGAWSYLERIWGVSQPN